MHPLVICFWLFAKPSRWSWYVSLPTQVAPSNSHEDLDGAVEAGDHVGDLLLPKLIHRLRPLRSSRR